MKLLNWTPIPKRAGIATEECAETPIGTYIIYESASQTGWLAELSDGPRKITGKLDRLESAELAKAHCQQHFDALRAQLLA